MIDLYYQKKKRGNYLHNIMVNLPKSKGVNYTDTLLTFPHFWWKVMLSPLRTAKFSARWTGKNFLVLYSPILASGFPLGTDHDFVVVKINNIESEDNIMKTFYECKTEEEKQEMRDSMLETIYYQMLATRNEVAEIRAKVRKIEQKLVYVGATPEERKYINVDGTLKLDAINETCDNILKLFGDKYVSEVKDND